MKEGLEGVVEFLLPELAFAGEQGLSVDGFLASTKQYFEGGKQTTRQPQQADQNNDVDGAGLSSASGGATTNLSDAELSFARGAWKWLVARPNVLVGGNRRWNKLSLDDVLALPEPVTPGDATPAPVAGVGATPAPDVPSSQTPVSTRKQRPTKSKPVLTVRPRIQVAEETVWQAIAGHGVDYKQIPRLEWHLLQGIAPTKYDGILQGDLRRLVGQDKRSVPKRTDFLAAKGYIVKRSIMVRASKTSKLWLAAFAPSETTEPGNAQQPKDIKMTKETLIRDLSSVPWHAKWTGTDIDVEMFAESVICIVKAWGVMRYSDLRQKMGVDELKWQMRVMARLTRNLVDMGVVKYTAATFANSRKVWKDCVKFIRDPTEAEWTKILATGKKTSKYTDLTKDRQPKPFALSLADKSTPQRRETPKKTIENATAEAGSSKSPTSRSLAGWVPEKPLVQTLFEAIDAAGPAGATNPQVSAGTVGYNFRRYVGTMLANMAMCHQPPHLQKFQLNRKMVRVDKTSAFMYTTTCNAQVAPSQEQSDQTPEALAEASATNASATPAPPTTSLYGFAPIQEGKMAKPGASLSEISRKLRGRHRPHAPPKRPRLETPADMEEARPSKRRRIDDGDVEMLDAEPEPPLSTEKLPGKPPGAYIGEPGSLNPNRKKNGRPKKSIVMISKTEKLKDPTFWETDWIAARNPDLTFLNVQYNGIPGRLCLNRRDKTVLFSRKPQEPGKEPLTILLEDLREEPVVRPVPGCDDNSLVIATKGSGNNPSWAYVFLFKDDPISQERVAEILKRVKSIMNGELIEATQPARRATAPSPIAAEAVSTAATPQGKAKGKGRGKKGAAGSGQKPWKCEKCGNAWKNDIGLKYHLTKAQVSCNPNWVPPAVPPVPGRKRKPPPPPLAPSGGNRGNTETDGNEEPGQTPNRRTTRQKGGTRPRRRLEIKLQHSGTPAFRGLTFDPGYASGPAQPLLPTHEVNFGSTSPVKTPRHDAPPAPRSSPGQSHGGQFTPINRLQPSSVNEPLEQTPQRVTASFSHVAEASTTSGLQLQHLGNPIDIGDEQPASAAKATQLPAATASKAKAQEISNRAPAYSNVSSNIISHASQAEDEVQSAIAIGSIASEAAKLKETPRRRPLPDKPVKRPQDQQESGLTPFKPASGYVHLTTDSKIRTAQALDIVEYLLQNNGGIFPGDKALFYAVLRIYLKAFTGQMPPSFKNLQVACKKLTSKGKAREIVHAFRHTNGKFVTCTMLLATDMDPNSIVPTVLKKKMQDAYPGVFIPPAFSPSKEELRLLEEFDREPAETEVVPKPEGKFRLRRDNMDVEVMTAPFYRDNPLELGVTPEPSEPEAPVNSQVADGPPRKRRKKGEPASAGATPSGRRSKKQKSLGSQLLSIPFARKKGSDVTGDAGDDGAADMEKEAHSSEPEATMGEPSTQNSTPIANAIKAYGLLPPVKAGPKKRRTAEMLKRVPREIGRIQNPGLTSLPYFFFTNKPHEYWSKHTHSTRLQFLEPNTKLDDFHVTSWFEELGDSIIADDTSSIASDDVAMSLPEGDGEPFKGFSFVEPVIIKELSPGVWLKKPPKESFEQSVIMQGWSTDARFALLARLPTDIDQMSSRDKRRRVKIEEFKDQAFAKFSELIDRCEGWEQSVTGKKTMNFGTIAPDYIFINASPPASVCQMKPIEPVWDSNNLFTMDTFPYKQADALADDEDEPANNRQKTLLFGKKPRGRPPGTTKTSPQKDQPADSRDSQEKKRVGRKPKRIRLPALEAEREHTAYPQSAEEYMDIHHGAERTPEWNSEHTQLAAFVCVTTLLGGVAKSVDWGLMMRLFPDMSLSHLRKFFGEMNKDRKSTIIDLTEKFQKAFLEAYEKGELPPLDYDNVLAYDWKALTLWTRSLAGDESTLPPSYEELAKRGMVVSDRAHQPRDWRETFWLPARSLYNRYQDSSSQAFAMAIDPQDEGKDINLRVAMSWVRALCVTAPTPPEVVSAKWETFKGLPRAVISNLIDKSIRILQERLVITKDKNLIVMRLNDRVVKALDKAAQDQKFAEATRFKHKLDRAFRKGKTRYRIPYVADDDGMIMAVLNLMGHDRITLETDNQYVPLGYEPFNYETRKFDRKYHHFRLFAAPTETYLYNSVSEHEADSEESDELEALLYGIQSTSPPRVGPNGELPLWVNFFGAIDEVRWRKCLGAVLFILSTRGPMRAEAIAEQLKCVVAFEVDMILEWADRLGLLEQMTPGAPKCVREWWWLAVDAQKKRADEAEARNVKGKGKERADAGGVGVDGSADTGWA
ncbi:hypothetical protein GE09DRAFT_960506 [Coniochaeta sp. 2T2.1]|nr:hypothetical protein GE09DRAFT_960506 [Coniochaeta sp. 2T2.1]